MLNITPIRGINQYAAAHYFATVDDYFKKDDIGEWQGHGAAALGLGAKIDQAQFAHLLDGHLPNGERIARTFDAKCKKRMGLDLTFSAPKSVSLQALVAGDCAVKDAHDRAVTAAMREVERLAATRLKVKGKSYRQRTNNLVIGKFRHEMSRAKDPQLHTHAIVLNMTRRADGRWRALANEEIFTAKKVIDGIYQTELANGLRQLGYEIRLVDDKGNFELAHITREQIEAFSDRSLAIEEVLANDGKTRATATTSEKQFISLSTRPRKDKAEQHLVRQYWLEKSQKLHIDYGRQSQRDARSNAYPSVLTGGSDSPANASVAHSYLSGPESSPPVTNADVLQQPLPTQTATSSPFSQQLTSAQAVLRYAILHHTEREAVVTESALYSTALHRAVGLADTAQIAEEIRRMVQQGALIEAPPRYRLVSDKGSPALAPSGWEAYLTTEHGRTASNARGYVAAAIKAGSLVPVEKRYTTVIALKRERAILAIERSGRHCIQPIMELTVVREHLATTDLNTHQRRAVETILAGSDRFVGIQGDAGTGKTHTVRKAESLIRAAGFHVVALAPYGNQVKALKQDGLQAQTLASLLYTKNNSIDRNTVVILDEAGVVGARQLEQVMRVVENAQARMVLLGDTKQTAAIEAGKPFAQLQSAGMLTVHISEILRQKDSPELKLAVSHAANGRVKDALEHIRHVEEIAESRVRHATIVVDYMKLDDAARLQTLIVAGTNAARREINAMVRTELSLVGTGREFDTFTRVDMTQAQRRFAPSYQPGMVIQPERDYSRAGLVRGDTYHVVEALPNNQLKLRRNDGTTTNINPRTTVRLGVYHLQRTELAVGDIVRINRSDPSRDLTNGDKFLVKGILGGVITLETPKENNEKVGRTVELLSLRPMHLEHAYSSTVHGSQGLTCERVLIALDTNSRTTSMNLFYVAISRAKQEARIYTNSLEQLPAAIARRFDKTTALQIQRDRQDAHARITTHLNIIEARQRERAGSKRMSGISHEPGGLM